MDREHIGYMLPLGTGMICFSIYASCWCATKLAVMFFLLPEVYVRKRIGFCYYLIKSMEKYANKTNLSVITL